MCGPHRALVRPRQSTVTRTVRAAGEPRPRGSQGLGVEATGRACSSLLTRGVWGARGVLQPVCVLRALGRLVLYRCGIFHVCHTPGRCTSRAAVLCSCLCCAHTCSLLESSVRSGPGEMSGPPALCLNPVASHFPACLFTSVCCLQSVCVSRGVWVLTVCCPTPS